MDINYFMLNKKILHLDNGSMTQSINELKYNDIVSFYKEINCIILNCLKIYKLNDNEYFLYEDLINYVDIISDIQITSNINTKIYLDIYGKLYEINNFKIPTVCHEMINLKLKVIFSKMPSNDDHYKITYKCHLVNNNLRDELIRNGVISNNLLFINNKIKEIN